MLPIAFDASGARNGSSGLATYIRELLQALFALPGDHRVCLFGLPSGAMNGLPALRRCPMGAMERVLLRHFPDPISPYLRAHLASATAAGQRGGGLVLTVHDVLFRTFSDEYPAGVRRRFEANLTAALPRVTWVLTPSRWSRERLMEAFPVPPDRVRVIPLAPSARFQPVPVEEARQAVAAKYGLHPPHLLFVGAPLPRKNLAGALAALALLRDRGHRDCRLAVVGATAKEAGALLRQKGPGVWDTAVNEARFLGKVSDADLSLLYHTATAFVYPSFAEGFGLPVLEAMACGLPVVTSSVSALPEVSGDAALLVDPRDPEHLAATLQAVLEDSSLRRQLQVRGRARARTFSWDQTARETLSLYQRL